MPKTVTNVRESQEERAKQQTKGARHTDMARGWDTDTNVGQDTDTDADAKGKREPPSANPFSISYLRASLDYVTYFYFISILFVRVYRWMVWDW